ncbi:MAG: histidine--tRNA ligase, partial [Desulfurococcales archaeon ex4484_217_2]
DKLDKIGYEGVREELAKAGYSNETIEKIIEIISISGSPEKVLDEIEEMYGGNRKVGEAVLHLREMLDFIKYRNKVSIELSLVRGLDYYTGPIFEYVVEKPKIGSIAGGGRYDNISLRFSHR